MLRTPLMSFRSLFLSTMVLGLLAAMPAEAFRMIQNSSTGMVTAGLPVACEDRGGFAHWEDHSQGWWMNSASANSTRISRMNSALASWTAVTGSDYYWFSYGTRSSGFSVDGRNTVTWGTGMGCSGNCLALTSLVLVSGQIIVESDITMRSDVTWTTDGSSTLDLQATLTHEFGHSLGIHHTNLKSVPLPTMWPTVFGSTGRSLENDDREALRCSISRYGRDRPGTTIQYQAHVAGDGWMVRVQDGATAGTTTEDRRMEAARMRIVNDLTGMGMGVCYQAHVRGHGWLPSVCDWSTGGTTGQSRRMEAIRVWLTNAPSSCEIEYQAYVDGNGWLPWVSNGQTAGTTGQSRQMEAMRARLVGDCN